MGDHHCGATLERDTQRPLHGRLALAVQVRGGLVQHHHVGLLEQQPRDRQSLLLAAGQTMASVADDCVEALRQAPDQIADPRRVAGGQDLVLGRVGTRVAQVRPDGVVEHVGVLGDHSDAACNDSCVTSRRSWPAIETLPSVGSYSRDTSPVIVVLPAPDGPTRATVSPAGTSKRHVVQDGPDAPVRDRARHRLQRRQRDLVRRGVAEPHVIEPDGGADPRGRTPASGLSATIGCQVQHLEHAVERHQRGHDVDAHVGQGRERPVQLRQQGDDGQQRSQGQRPVDHQVAAQTVGDGGGQGGDQRQGGEEVAVGQWRS